MSTRKKQIRTPRSKGFSDAEEPSNQRSDIPGDQTDQQPYTVAIQQFFEYCIVNRNIMQGKERIGAMFREEPSIDIDSGWRIMTGSEPNDFNKDDNNILIIPLGYVIAIDRSISDLLDAPVGTIYVRPESAKRFSEVRFSRAV